MHIEKGPLENGNLRFIFRWSWSTKVTAQVNGLDFFPLTIVHAKDKSHVIEYRISWNKNGWNVTEYKTQIYNRFTPSNNFQLISYI